MSSRNSYLTPAQRAAAPVLQRSLQAVAEAYQAGERSAQELRRLALSLLGGEPTAQVEYVSVADARTLAEVDRVDRPVLVSMAVRIGRARLIDNLLLGT
jgi:pantoate--beta-alanine ligase